TQACEAEYAQTKQQIDDQFKKEQRRAKKTKEETGWHALTDFEGTRDEGVKWRRATEADWFAAIAELHVRQDEANLLLKRCGGLAKGSPEEEAAAAAAAPTVDPTAPPRGEPPADGAAPSTPDQPAEDNPLTRLRSDITRIEDELVALD